MKKAVWVLIFSVILLCMCVGTASAGPAMDRILEKGQLVVGMTGSQPPLNVTAKDGNIIGFDADIAKAMMSINAVKGVEIGDGDGAGQDGGRDQEALRPRQRAPADDDGNRGHCDRPQGAGAEQAFI